MAAKNTSDEIYKLLQDKGFTKPYIHSLLPDWWDDSISENPAGLSEFKIAISRNLGVNFESLNDANPDLTFRLPHDRRLKRSVNYNEVQLTPAISVGISAARTALAAMRIDYQPLPDATEIRRIILEDLGANYVSLRSLISVCWKFGIPVLHVSGFPAGMAKMDGLVLKHLNRPAIVLAKVTPFSAWMSFVLAHEIGHIALNHCSSDQIIVDESIGENQFQTDGTDQEEAEADQFALKLLSGLGEKPIAIEPHLTARDIANRAMQLQTTFQIDAGHVILRSAFETNNWRLFLTALKIIDTQDSAVADITTALFSEIDVELLSDSSLKFLSRVCNLRLQENGQA